MFVSSGEDSIIRIWSSGSELSLVYYTMKKKADSKQCATMWLKRFSVGLIKKERKITNRFILKQNFFYFIIKYYWPLVSLKRLF